MKRDGMERLMCIWKRVSETGYEDEREQACDLWAALMENGRFLLGYALSDSAFTDASPC